MYLYASPEPMSQSGDIDIDIDNLPVTQKASNPTSTWRNRVSANQSLTTPADGDGKQKTASVLGLKRRLGSAQSVQLPNRPEFKEESPGNVINPRREENSNYPLTLLVEDNSVSVKVVQLSLRNQKLNVTTVCDGESAVEKFKKDSFKLVLMDIQLPKMNGVEATRLIRQFEQETRREPCLIFAVTGNCKPEELATYKEAGLNGCIAKGKLLVQSLRTACIAMIQNKAEFVSIIAD